MTLDDLRRAAELLPAGSSLTLSREAILEALATTPVADPAAVPVADRWLTAQDVAQRLHCSVRHVYAKRHTFPFARQLPGTGGVRFSEQGLEAWMKRATFRCVA